MKEYKIIYRENLIHAFFVEAESKEEAEEKFEEGLMNGEFDFSDGEVDDSSYEIREV